tara:strand:- start:147 stop:503 length:357 start_codon:yes stop_codon:yes gene_type:complete
MMTSDPSQVRVQVITTDAKAQQVVDAITTWRTTNQKLNKGLENDAIITPLSGASSEYIGSIIKSTTFSVTAYQTNSREIPKDLRSMIVAQVGRDEGQSLVQSTEAGEQGMDNYISGFY